MSLPAARFVSAYTSRISALDPTIPSTAHAVSTSTSARRRSTSALTRSYSASLDTSRYTYKSPRAAPPPLSTGLFLLRNSRRSGGSSEGISTTLLSLRPAAADPPGDAGSGRFCSRNRSSQSCQALSPDIFFSSSSVRFISFVYHRFANTKRSSVSYIAIASSMVSITASSLR